MHHIIGGVVIGAVLGGVSIRSRLRPALLGIVKGGIVAKRKLEAAAVEAMEQTHKLVDEARAELDHTHTEDAN
jgi:hypothetical protein